ncbi:MAG: Eco57I restriction-modification methylase domain-containing protein [Candidatus Thorarchaeota archaeon]
MSELKKQFFKEFYNVLNLFTNLNWKIGSINKKNDYGIEIISKLIILQIFNRLKIKEFQEITNTWRHRFRDHNLQSRQLIHEFFSHTRKLFSKFSGINFLHTNELEFLLDEEDNWDNLKGIINKILFEKNDKNKDSLFKVFLQDAETKILGQAYEVLLGVIRKERGIYYTPKFVTSHISEKICYYIFNPLIEKLGSLLKSNADNYKIQTLLKRIIDIKILDPACGCGSFLVRIFEEIIKYYEKIIELLNKKVESNSLSKPYQEYLRFLGADSDDLYSKILLRHIFGVDLDVRALEIAKFNLSLAIIMRLRKSKALLNFFSSNIPNLSLNLRQGNSIIQISQGVLRRTKYGIKLKEFIRNLTAIRKEIIHRSNMSGQIRKTAMELDSWRNQLLVESFENLEQYDSKGPGQSKENRLLNEFIRIVKSENELGLIYRKNDLIDRQKILNMCSSFLWSLDFANIKFDAILGNPPYVDVKRLPDLVTQYLFKFYKFSFNRVNLFCAFSELATTENLLKNGGFFGFVVPNPIFIKTSYKQFRDFWLNHHRIYQIIRIPNSSFKNEFLDKQVNIEPVILISQLVGFKHPIRNKYGTEVLAFYTDFEDPKDKIKLVPENSDLAHEINQEHWLENANLIIDWWNTSKTKEIISKIEEDSVELEEICNRSLGITPYDKYKGHTNHQIQNKVFHFAENTKNTAKNPQRLLTGKSIRRYKLEWPTSEDCWLDYGNWLGAPREWKFFSKPRILIRQIRTGIYFLRIFATIVNNSFVNTQPIFNIILKKEKENDFYLEYILSLLNSYLMSWYYHWKFMDPGKKSQSKVLIENARKLPIKSIPKENQVFFRKKVIQYLYLNNYLRMWEKIFNENHQLLGGNNKISILELKVQSKLNKGKQQKKYTWFHYFQIFTPFDDVNYKLPDSFYLNFKINNSLDKKVAIIYIFNPEIGTKKLFEFEARDNEIFELIIIGIYNYIMNGKNKYPKSVDKLLDKMLVPIKEGSTSNCFFNSKSLVTETREKYENFIKSPKSLEFCEIIDHSDKFRHENLYADHMNSDLKLIQSTLIFSDLILIRDRIDAELEAKILRLYDIDYNTIFDNIMISTLEKERIKSFYLT